jgi:proton-dependent oligopeptide transporter, POT family
MEQGAQDIERRHRLWTIIAISVWERYSYDTVMVLLPLFLIGAKVGGGFQWSEPDALLFTGTVLAAMQVGMFIGGVVTDRWLGSRRAMITGAWCMLTAHVFMLGPLVAPALASRLTGVDVHPLLLGISIHPGDLFAGEAVHAAVSAITPLPGAADAATTAYIASAWTFHIALSLLVIGNSLFKPTVTLLPGRLGYPSDQARDAAYTQVYMGRNLGIALAGLIAGLVAQVWNWHLALFTGAIGMALALLIMRWAWQKFLRQLLDVPDVIALQVSPERVSRRAAAFALLLLLAVCAFSIIYDQSGGLGATFAETKIDRDVLGWSVPVAWLLALNPVVIVLVTPWVTRQLLNPGSRLARMNSFDRYAASFALLAIGTMCYLFAAVRAQGAAAPGWWWIAAAIFWFTLAEILIAPIGESTITKMVPRRMQTRAMGIWFAFIGIGGWLSGVVGASASSNGAVTVFVAITAGALICVGIMRLLAWRFPHLAF